MPGGGDTNFFLLVTCLNEISCICTEIEYISKFASGPADKAIFIASISSHRLQLLVLNYINSDCK